MDVGGGGNGNLLWGYFVNIYLFSNKLVIKLSCQISGHSLTNLNLLYAAFVLPLLQRVRVVEVPLVRIRGKVGLIVFLLLAFLQLTVPPFFSSNITGLWNQIRFFPWFGSVSHPQNIIFKSGFGFFRSDPDPYFYNRP